MYMFKAHVMKVNEYTNVFCLIIIAQGISSHMGHKWDQKNESIRIETAEL